MARGSRIAKVATSIVTLPITVAVVLFAVSNRNIVEVQFWPLPGTLGLPLYVIGLVTMVIGFRSLETKLSDSQSETEKARTVVPPAKIAAE
jgi:uncharacterized integral membrane protein